MSSRYSIVVILALTVLILVIKDHKIIFLTETIRSFDCIQKYFNVINLGMVMIRFSKEDQTKPVIVFMNHTASLVHWTNFNRVKEFWFNETAWLSVHELIKNQFKQPVHELVPWLQEPVCLGTNPKRTSLTTKNRFFNKSRTGLAKKTSLRTSLTQ